MKSDKNILIAFIFNFMFYIFELVGVFLLKIPNNINLDDIRKKLLKVEGITDIHHVHVWSTDGECNYATLHVKTNKGNAHKVKKDVKDLLAENNIIHTTIEIESNKKYHY